MFAYRRGPYVAAPLDAAQLLCSAIQRWPAWSASIIPGINESHTSGRAHQISRATASTASAPPCCVPSERRNFNSRSNSWRRRPKRAPTRGSCKGATARPRRSSIGSSHLAMRVQKPHWASKKSQPRACRPFPSVYSLASEIMAYLVCTSPLVNSLSNCLLLFVSKQGNDLAAQFADALQRAHRHPQNFFEQAGHGGQKSQHAFQPLPSVGIALRAALQFLHTFIEHSQRGIDFTPLALLGDGAKNLPDVLGGLEMVAAIPEHMHDSDNAPPLQFTQAGAHVRTGHGQRRGDFVGRHRLGGKKKQGVNLGDGAVDTPLGAHLAPMQDEFLGYRSK